MQKPQHPAEGERVGKDQRDALLMRMRKAVEALQASPREKFDAVAHCMILAHDSAALLELLFGRDKLKQWMESDDPRFDRFASRLKMSLERIRGYLDSVSELFAPGGDVVREKITTAQREIEAVLERFSAQGR